MKKRIIKNRNPAENNRQDFRFGGVGAKPFSLSHTFYYNSNIAFNYLNWFSTFAYYEIFRFTDFEIPYCIIIISKSAIFA